MFDIGFRWWAVLALSLVFAGAGLFLHPRFRCLSIEAPAKMLGFGVASILIGVFIGIILSESWLDVLLLKSSPQSASRGGAEVWWAVMVYGYASAIVGLIGCVISLLASAMRTFDQK